MKFISLFIIYFILSLNLYAQNDSIKFSKDFKFKDGIYVSQDDFKNNSPSLTEENFSNYNRKLKYLDNNFFESSDFNEYIRRYVLYPDKYGNIQKHAIDSLFGFVINGFPFAIMSRKRNAGFKVLRIFQLGTISYCFEIKASTKNEIFPSKKEQRVNSPLLSVMPEMDSFGNTSKIQQFFIYFDTGEFYKFNLSNFQ